MSVVVRKAKKLDDEHYVIESIPIFCEHDKYEDNGERKSINLKDMKKIIKRMCDFGPSAVIIGHTDDDNEYDEKDVKALAVNFRLKNIDGRRYLVCDFITKYPDLLNKYPRRSVELWDDYTINPIALLGSSTPKLDLPASIIKFSRKKYSDNNTESRSDRMSEDKKELVEQIVSALQNTAEWKFISNLLKEWESMQEQLQQQSAQQQQALAQQQLAEQMLGSQAPPVSNETQESDKEDKSDKDKDNKSDEGELVEKLKTLLSENDAKLESKSSRDDEDEDEDKDKESNDEHEDEEQDLELIERVLHEYLDSDKDKEDDSKQDDDVEKHQQGPMSSFIPGHASVSSKGSQQVSDVKVRKQESKIVEKHDHESDDNESEKDGADASGKEDVDKESVNDDVPENFTDEDVAKQIVEYFVPEISELVQSVGEEKAVEIVQNIISKAWDVMLHIVDEVGIHESSKENDKDAGSRDVEESVYNDVEDKKEDEDKDQYSKKYARQLESEVDKYKRMYWREHRLNVFNKLLHDGYGINVEEELKNTESMGEREFNEYVSRISKYYRKAPVSNLNYEYAGFSHRQITQEMRDRAIEYATLNNVSFEEALNKLFGGSK